MTDSSFGIGLYLHIPFCERKCPYCGFYSIPLSGHSPEKLLHALLKEMNLYEIAEPVQTMYIGGGSPTCLPEASLLGLVRAMKKRFGEVKEFSVECNPAQVNDSLFDTLRHGGVNRISIGAQSFDAEELTRLGRLHGPEQISKAVRAAYSAGFENVGLDLMFGLPHSNLKTWRDTLEKATALNVQHISAYSLTLERNTPFDKASQEGNLTMPDEAVERAMYEQVCERLRSSGFEHYEISNFAKHGFQCRHNLRYWQNRPVLGIGPAAGSWYHGRRTMNVPDVQHYIDAIENGRFPYVETRTPAPKEIASETAVLNLRLLEGIHKDQYRRQTGFDVDELFDSAIQKNHARGLLHITDSRISLTDKGLSFADTVAQDFVLSDKKT